MKHMLMKIPKIVILLITIIALPLLNGCKLTEETTGKITDLLGAISPKTDIH